MWLGGRSRSVSWACTLQMSPRCTHIRAQNLFPIQLEDETKHPVCSRVLRPDGKEVSHTTTASLTQAARTQS